MAVSSRLLLKETSVLISVPYQLQSFTIQGEKLLGPTALTMCDIMGLGEEEDTGISFDDIVSVTKGYAPEGHKVKEEALEWG